MALWILLRQLVLEYTDNRSFHVVYRKIQLFTEKKIIVLCFVSMFASFKGTKGMIPI